MPHGSRQRPEPTHKPAPVLFHLTHANDYTFHLPSVSLKTADVVDIDGAFPTPGVYSNDAEGRLKLVHRYQGGDYELHEIVDFFNLGTIESTDDESVIVLTSKELNELKILASAHSFDYEEAFIEMCMEMQRFAVSTPTDRYRFIANF